MNPRPPALAAASHAYFLDFDGTLVNFEHSLAEIRLSDRLAAVLATLRRDAGGAVALISGRSLQSIDHIFHGHPTLPAAGQHGVERRLATDVVRRIPVSPEPLNRVRRALPGALARFPSLLVEDKGESIALHYRRAPSMGRTAHRIMRAMLAAAGPQYMLQHGSCVVDLKPRRGDKGHAIAAFMRERPFRGRIPVFIGDDMTDEDGFAVVNRLRGISIKVGRGPTSAKWRLPDSRAVIEWLVARPAKPAIRRPAKIKSPGEP
jgi:trehalose 6-phosphate phosphatase